MEKQVWGGSMEKRGDKTWRLRVSLGKDPETGKYLRSKSITFHGTKREAKLALEDYRREIEDQINNPASTILFSDYANNFYKEREDLGLSPITRTEERREIDFLNKIFDGYYLSEIKKDVIVKGYKQAETKYNLSKRSVYDLSKRLKMILNQAIDEELLEKNYASLVKVKIPKSIPPKPLTKQESLRLVSVLDSLELSYLTVAIRIMLFSGIRVGEVQGLTWGYVDFDRNTIKIVRQFSYDSNLRDPKTPSSNRTITLDDKTMSILKEWKEIQPTKYDPRIGFVQNFDTPVIANEYGEFFNSRKFGDRFRKFCIDYGFGKYTQKKEYVYGKQVVKKDIGYEGLIPHALRHTNSTLLVGAGVDPKTVQARLGHTDVSFTLNRYTDFVDENDIKAAQILSEMLADTKQSEGDDGNAL